MDWSMANSCFNEYDSYLPSTPIEFWFDFSNSPHEGLLENMKHFSENVKSKSNSVLLYFII
jgi:hypothetical protein